MQQSLLAVVTCGVWIWALSLLEFGAFPNLESAVYFALVAFTTLGLGDMVAPQEWRILSAMAAVNGFLSFGLLSKRCVRSAWLSLKSGTRTEGVLRQPFSSSVIFTCPASPFSLAR